MWYPCTLRVFVIPAEEILELLLLQGDLRWVPLLPPSPTPEKREAATSSSTGPASKTAATAKTKKKGTSVDGEQGSDVAGGGDSRQGADKGLQSGGKSGRQGDDESFEFSWAGVEDLAKTHDLCATGHAFELALATGEPEIGRYIRLRSIWSIKVLR